MEGSFEVGLRHQGILSECCEKTYSVVDCRICKGELFTLDVVINTVPWWSRELHYYTPLSVLLGHHP